MRGFSSRLKLILANLSIFQSSDNLFKKKDKLVCRSHPTGSCFDGATLKPCLPSCLSVSLPPLSPSLVGKKCLIFLSGKAHTHPSFCSVRKKHVPRIEVYTLGFFLAYIKCFHMSDFICAQCGRRTGFGVRRSGSGPLSGSVAVKKPYSPERVLALPHRMLEGPAPW